MNPVWLRDSIHLAFWDVGRFGALLKVASLESGPTREILRRTHWNWDGLYALAWMTGGHELLLTPDRRHVVAVDIDTGRQREIHTSPPGTALGAFAFLLMGSRSPFAKAPRKGTRTNRPPFTSCHSALTGGR